MESNELGQLEQKVLTAFNSDGAAETLMGSALLLAGLNMAAQSNASVVGMLPIFVILLARAWKKRITYPRLGFADFTKRYRAKRLTMITVLLLVLVLALIAIQYVPGGQAKLIMGIVLAEAITMPAILRGHRSFYFFGALCLALILAAYFAHIRSGYAIAAMGSILLVTGLFRLKQFLDKHPRQAGETSLES